MMSGESDIIVTCTKCGESRTGKMPQCSCWAVVGHIVLGEWTVKQVPAKSLEGTSD